MYGSAEYKKQHYTWNADGDVILTLGGAFTFPGNVFIPNQVLSFDMEATSFKVLHLKDVDVGAATGATNTIDVCGCLSLSQFIYFKHNFNRDNLFYDFLEVSKKLDCSPDDIIDYINTQIDEILGY